MSLVFIKDIPYIEELNVFELSKKVPTPFYIYSQKNIIDNYNYLKSTLKKSIYFSIKSNSNQAIITLLRSLGAGADVVSKEELQRALSAKFKNSKIIFEGVGKSKEDLEFAIKKKIRQINIESIEELKLIEKIAINLKYTVPIGIRLNPNIDAKTIDKISTGKKTDKFGIDFNQLSTVCRIIKKSKSINLVGLSCHVGSQIFKLNVFEKTIVKMKKAINILSALNLSIQHLDLGGGFGVDYKSGRNLDLSKLSLLIEKNFKNSEFDISFEPGRYIVANSGTLITKILTVKQNSSINFLITDAGMQTLIRPAMYNAYHKIISLNKKGNKVKYTIAGPICESSDILSKNIQLPKQKIDNLLAICDVGAYGSVMASNYNSKCLPAEILINKSQFKIIRYQQKINDLIDKDKIPMWL